MEDAEEAAVEPAEPPDVVARFLSLLAELDPQALVVNFITVVEWIEPDGQPSLSVIGTPMAPWQISGLLNHVVKDIETQVAVHNFAPIDLPDEDDDDF